MAGNPFLSERTLDDVLRRYAGVVSAGKLYVYLLPCILFVRLSISWSVLSSAWPTCSEPVTFGGGMTIEKAGLGDEASALKSPFSTH